MSADRSSLDERPLFVLVSSGVGSLREYFMQSVSRAYRVWLLMGGTARATHPTWERPYIAGHSIVDTLDAEAMTEAVREISERTTVTGVMCYDEARIEASAKVCQALGLPGPDPASVYRCRDKHATRCALAAAGVPQPESVVVSSLQSAREVAERIDYPVVLKPRNLAGSFGVVKVSSETQLREAYLHTAGTFLPEAPEVYEGRVLVEECVTGPEISVDSAVIKGRVYPLAIARKEVGFPPYFEETGHLVNADDPLQKDEAVTRVLNDAHAAVGFSGGMTHLEMKLTPTGPKVIEINARMGGDMVPYLAYLASGVDLSMVGADIACGRAPNSSPTRHRVAAIRFLYPNNDMTVKAVRINESMLPAAVDRAVALARPGQQLKLPPAGFSWVCRSAYVVAVADTLEEVRAALDAAAQAISVDPSEVDVQAVAEH